MEPEPTITDGESWDGDKAAYDTNADIMMRLTQEGTDSLVDHASNDRRARPGNRERGGVDDDRGDLAEVAGVEPEDQHGGLHGNRHDHLVGERKAVGRLPARVGDEEGGQLGEVLLLGSVEDAPVSNAATNDLLPINR